MASASVTERLRARRLLGGQGEGWGCFGKGHAVCLVHSGRSLHWWGLPSLPLPLNLADIFDFIPPSPHTELKRPRRPLLEAKWILLLVRLLEKVPLLMLLLRYF